MEKMGGHKYDATTQMFVEEEPRTPQLESLKFLRWMAEQGKLEHAIAGAPSGEYAIKIGLQEARTQLQEFKAGIESRGERR